MKSPVPRIASARVQSTDTRSEFVQNNINAKPVSETLVATADVAAAAAAAGILLLRLVAGIGIGGFAFTFVTYITYDGHHT